MNDKPIILVIKETESAILDIVNKAGLPAFFLRYILDRIEKDLTFIEQNELATATEVYKSKSNEKEVKKK